MLYDMIHGIYDSKDFPQVLNEMITHVKQHDHVIKSDTVGHKMLLGFACNVCDKRWMFRFMQCVSSMSKWIQNREEIANAINSGEEIDKILTIMDVLNN
jgi:hypothetical protein